MGLADSPVVDRGQSVVSFDLADHPMPSGREEPWRFTPLRRLARVLADEPSDARLTWKDEVPAGVEVVPIDAAEAARRSVQPPVDRPSALAVTHSGGAVLIRVPAEAEIAEPIVLRLAGQGADQLVWGWILVEVGHHAKATLIIEHTGSASYSSSVSIDVADGASLDVVSLQLWDDDAVHAGHHALRLGRDARARSFVATLGGETVRLVQTVDFAAPGGDVELLGVYFSDAGQHLEHRLFVDHAHANCRSNAAYKGALQGSGARSVWIGDVLIRAEAVGTDTYELNRNLLLSEGARADSVPNLEIETGEIVGAGHASATGRFDDEQLFYLQSRGIPEAQARRLVVRGFFADVVGRLAVPDIQLRLMDAIEAELARSEVGAG